MGHLTRTYDWANSPLGSPDQWPQSLRTTLGIVLHSPFPMFLFWADQLICFYNDAYRPILGANGKHPAILGKPGKEAWPEVWYFIEPMTDQVMTTGVPIWHEDLPVPVPRNGQLEDAYFTFSYSPVFGDDSQIAGVLVTCTETTEKVATAKLQQEKNELLQAVFDSSSAGISVVSSVRNEQGEIIDFDYRLVNRVTEQANNRTDLVGKRYSAIHSKYREAGLFDDFKAVVNTGKAIERERHYTGEGFDNWYETTAVRLGDGVVLSFRDITATVRARHGVEESEHYLRQLTDTIPAIIWETRADGYCTYLNKQWYALTGQSPAEAEGFGWLDATHPDDKAEAGRLFEEANQQQTAFSTLYRLRHNDGSHRWAIDQSNPRFGADGQYLGMIGTVVDVHEQIMAEDALRQSREQQTFLLELSDTLHSLPDPAEVQAEACRLLGERLAVDRAYYAEVDEVTQSVQISQEYRPGETISMIGQFRLADYGWVLPVLKRGEAVVVADAKNDPLIPEADQTAMQAIGIEAHIAVPVIKAGVLMSTLSVSEKEPRAWTKLEIELVRETAERTWEAIGRARAEQEVAQFKYMADHASDPFILMREDGTFAYLNQLALDRWGYTADEARHIRVSYVDPIYNDDVFSAAFARAQREKIPPFETLHRRKDGHIYPVEVNMGGLMLAGKPHMFAVARDLTARQQADEALRQSEVKLRSVVETAPIAIGLFVGRDLVIELPNQTFIDIVGKGPDITGKPLRKVMPELLTENQPFLQILDDVFTSGKPFHTFGSPVKIVRHGVMTESYYNITYSPLFDEAGAVYAILDIAVDVTEQVLARQTIEEAEAALRGAVEMAQLGTWSIDVATNELTYSDRLIDWFGYDPKKQAYSEVIPILEAGDRKRVETAVAWALNPASDGVYDEVYTIIHPKTGQKRILHAQGKTVFDATGKAVRMNGTAQDITIQRELQLALENEVQERTRQLQASVHDLERSNQNLQQFAYVASHDLQEPLRKIQSFADLLKSQYGDRIGEGTEYLARMQTAASRMSALIKDLLSFSRISTQQEATDSVSLTDVVQAALSTLEIVVQEADNQVVVEPLPTVSGDASQLGQLFQNLLSNALKFRRTNVPARIQVRSQRVADTELPLSIRPTRLTPFYHRIDVIDNGIGFDEKYVSRIFQVFQRLHGRSEFAGTGIGLAICEKVAANHGGAISATSQLGQGSTFSVYLPVA